MRIAVPVQLSFAFHLHRIYFYILSLSVYMCLCIWSGFLVNSIYIYIYIYSFCIHSASLCLLVRTFNPFAFKVIINLSSLFFTKIEQIISQFVCKYKKKKKTSDSQSNIEKEEWDWRNQPAWLQAILQSYSHQDSMLLAQRQKYISMEQSRKPRDKSTHLWTPYLWQRMQEYGMENKQITLTSGAGKIGLPIVK